MAKFGKNLNVSGSNYSGAGLLTKISFSGKVYLVLFLLVAGLFVQSILFLSYFYEYRNDLMNIALSRRTNDDTLRVLHDLSQDLLEKFNLSSRSGILVDGSDDIVQISQAINSLKNNLNGNIALEQINKIEALIDQFGRIASPITADKYQAAAKSYGQYNTAVNNLENVLSKHYQRNYQEILVIILIKCVIIFSLLLLEIWVCKLLFKRALWSIDEPADRIIRFLKVANVGSQVKSPVFTSEGLGNTGLILNEGISRWHTLTLSFKNASNKLNYLVDELASSFNQVFFLEVQLREAYLEIEASLNGQEQIGKKVNEEIEVIISDLSELQNLPRKVTEISEELNSLFTVNKEYLDGVLDRQVEVNNESHDVIVFLQDLGATSERVDLIMKELREIQEESEMLAFNSAISAARAGEEGQGFSVVAKEIANLVERSKKASNNLGGLIAEIQTKTEQIVGIIPEDGLIKSNKLSLDQTINSICLNLSETATKCLTELDQMRQVVETIFVKSNETFEELNSTSGLPQVKTGQLSEIQNTIARYLESVKHTGEVTDKISGSVNSLQSATDLLINRNA